MRNYELMVLDSDGEEQTYRYVAADAFQAARLARRVATMYGHKAKDAVTITVAALVADADMTNAVTPTRTKI